jgi:hypothetical protein
MAVATSHAPGLGGFLDKASAEDQGIIGSMFKAVHDAVVASATDVLVIIANDHVENARLYDYPDFNFGLAARHKGPAEWFKPWLKVPDYDVPGSPDVARALCRAAERTAMTVRGTDGPLNFHDNISVPVTLARLAETQVAVVPVLQNCTVPPVPDEQACYGFGAALSHAIAADLPDGLRIGLYGSGGLSHEPGGPRYLEVNEKFDRWWMDLVSEGDHRRVLDEVTFERMEEAGSGGTSELLSWMVVMGAIGQRPCRPLGYAVGEEFRCGIGGVQWDLTAEDQ